MFKARKWRLRYCEILYVLYKILRLFQQLPLCGGIAGTSAGRYSSRMKHIKMNGLQSAFRIIELEHSFLDFSWTFLDQKKHLKTWSAPFFLALYISSLPAICRSIRFSPNFSEAFSMALNGAQFLSKKPMESHRESLELFLLGVRIRWAWFDVDKNGSPLRSAVQNIKTYVYTLTVCEH